MGMLFNFFRQLNAQTLASKENVAVEKGNKVSMNVDIQEVVKNSMKFFNPSLNHFFINTDETAKNVFKRYHTVLSCSLKKGTDVVDKDGNRLTLSNDVNVNTTELGVILEKGSLKNGVYGKIVNATNTLQNVDNGNDKKLKRDEVLFVKMPDNTVYALKNNNLFLPNDDKTNLFQNFFYFSENKKLETLNLKFKKDDELNSFVKNEKYVGTIMDLDWFKHLADEGFDYSKRQYDLEFVVKTQGNVVLIDNVDVTPSTNAAKVDKTGVLAVGGKTTEKKKMGTGLKVFLWLLFIAILAAVAYGAYFLIQKRKKAQIIEEQV